MIIIKAKRMQERIKPYGYNPGKRVQWVKIFCNKKGYLKNIAEQFRLLFGAVGMMIISPFMVLYHIYEVLKSLLFWSLVITKKDIVDEDFIVNGTFRDPKETCCSTCCRSYYFGTGHDDMRCGLDDSRVDEAWYCQRFKK